MQVTQLTPNQRLAAYIGEALPIRVWFEQLYRQLIEAYPRQFPSLLSLAEQEILWEKIIQNSETGEHLLKVSETARLAIEAWDLIKLWDIRDFDHYFLTEEASIYLAWQKTYQTHCLKNHWTDFTACVDILIDAVDNKLISLPESIQLVGFDEIPPQWQRFFAAVEKKGCVIKQVSLLFSEGEVRRLTAETKEEELRLACLWAKKALEKNQGARLGIVVPDLEQRRNEVMRIFKETLAEASFNVAAPKPLANYPFIEAVFLTLSLMQGELTLEKISKFLRSPFFGKGITEMSDRAVLDLSLRAWGESTFSWKSLINKCQMHNASLEVITFFQKLSTLKTKLYGKQIVDYWMDLIIQITQAVEWPGERTLDLKECHMKECWENILSNYIRLDRVLGVHSFGEAIQTISRLAYQKPFLPKTITPQNSLCFGSSNSHSEDNSPSQKTVLEGYSDPQIQILGLLEASGIPFDFLWVTGLTRDTWPLIPAPNPFIPLHIQRDKNCPRCSPERELSVATRLTDNFCKAAKKVIFSTPLMQEDNPAAISSLLLSIEETSLEALGLTKPKSYLEQIAEFEDLPSSMGDLIFEKAPKVPKNQPVLGGGRLLKLQALCPFRAFAEIRLEANPIPEPTVGLAPSERGEMIHQVLHLFWKGIKDQTELNSLSEDELIRALEKSIESVAEIWRKRRPNTLKPTYFELEKERLFKVIYHFIQLEKTRPHFTIQGLEVARSVKIGEIELKLRIDRIDRLDNGEDILIDFKTGQTSVSDWFGERPREPQLPLYCVTHEQEPCGVAFGVIRPFEAFFHGLTKEKELLPKVNTLDKLRVKEKEENWASQNLKWKSTMTNLVKDFSEGVADVAPLDGESTCRLCHLKMLCRVKHHLS